MYTRDNIEKHSVYIALNTLLHTADPLYTVDDKAGYKFIELLQLHKLPMPGMS